MRSSLVYLRNFAKRSCKNNGHNGSRYFGTKSKLLSPFVSSKNENVITSNKGGLQAQLKSVLSLGQPTFDTNLLKSSNEIIPGVTKEEFKVRRFALCSEAQKAFKRKHPDIDANELSHLIIIPSSSKKFMTENIPYPYRQNSNYFYLTGSYDQDSLLVIALTAKDQWDSIFLQDPDPLSDLWDGPRTSPNAALNHFGFDRAFYKSEFESFIAEFYKLSKNRAVIWCDDRNFFEKNMTKHSPEFQTTLMPAKEIIDVLRNVKSEAEVNLMKESCSIASAAFRETMKFCRKRSKNLNEHHIWAKLDYETRLRGAERLAYPPVVATGGRANIIHYVFNIHNCNPTEMVLVDAGCEYYGYCSDITRTFPVNGKFEDDKQTSLYQMILEMQCDLVKMVQPGITLDLLFREMGSMMVKGLDKLGILNKSLNLNSQTQEVALRFCPHHVGHYLGMDVHDTPSIERSAPLVPGNVITIEPGIYIRDSSSQHELMSKIGREFTGIAIRIEDDVLVTEKGHFNLTALCPKTIQDIQNCAASK